MTLLISCRDVRSDALAKKIGPDTEILRFGQGRDDLEIWNGKKFFPFNGKGLSQPNLKGVNCVLAHTGDADSHRLAEVFALRKTTVLFSGGALGTRAKSLAEGQSGNGFSIVPAPFAVKLSTLYLIDPFVSALRDCAATGEASIALLCLANEISSVTNVLSEIESWIELKEKEKAELTLNRFADKVRPFLCDPRWGSQSLVVRGFVEAKLSGDEQKSGD